MSQHYLETEAAGLPVLVQMGWDKPLQRFYLVVFRVEESGEADEVLYSNLDDFAADNIQDLQYFQDILQKLEITVPASLIEQVKFDKTRNTVNRVVEYDASGRTLRDTDLRSAV